MHRRQNRSETGTKKEDDVDHAAKDDQTRRHRERSDESVMRKTRCVGNVLPNMV